MVSFSSLASMSARPALPNIWRGGGLLPRRDGRRSFATCRRYCCDGPFRSSDNLVPTAIWIADHGPWPAADPLVWRHRASDGRMDRQPTHSGLWLGANPSLPDQGPRWRRRRNCHTSSQVHRYSRSPDVSSLTLAKRLCRTVDRFDPQGMHGSHHGIWRTPSAPRAAILYGLLQRHAHSLVIGQGCADIARGRARWKHSLLSNPRRSPSPIYPDLISGRDTGSFAARSSAMA